MATLGEVPFPEVEEDERMTADVAGLARGTEVPRKIGCSGK